MNFIISLLKSIWKWLVILLLIAIAGFLFIHFLWPKPQITLPGGQVINMDTKSFNSAVQQILKGQKASDQKVNDLESSIRQLQTHTVDQDIPAALKETDIRKSVDKMKEAWKR